VDNEVEEKLKAIEAIKASIDMTLMNTQMADMALRNANMFTTVYTSNINYVTYGRFEKCKNESKRLISLTSLMYLGLKHELYNSPICLYKE